MAQEKVFIILSHKHSLKKDKNGKGIPGEWEVAETVEFVNQLRKRHNETSIAVADYTNKKMLSGTRYGMTDYNAFIEYLIKKYPKQMKELDEKYGEKVELDVSDEPPELYSVNDLITDRFGNIRPRTVFDAV